MAGIETLHWDELPEDCGRHWSPAGGRPAAVWPGPVDHDICFKRAGFTEFADTDQAWDRNLDQLVDAVVERLRGLGQATMKQGV